MHSIHVVRRSLLARALEELNKVKDTKKNNERNVLTVRVLESQMQLYLQRWCHEESPICYNGVFCFVFKSCCERWHEFAFI